MSKPTTILLGKCLGDDLGVQVHKRRDTWSSTPATVLLYGSARLTLDDNLPVGLACLIPAGYLVKPASAWSRFISVAIGRGLL